MSEHRGSFVSPVWMVLLEYISPPPPPLCFVLLTLPGPCAYPQQGVPLFCLSEKVKIAPLQGSLAASVFPLVFVGNWKCSETG